MTDESRFKVTAIRRNPPKHNGEPRRNWIDVDLIVDGQPHTIHIRNSTGKMRAADLEKRPDWPDIKKGVTQFFVTTILEPAHRRHLAQRTE